MRIYSGMSPNVRHVLRVACHLPILVMRPKKRHVTPEIRAPPIPRKPGSPHFPSHKLLLCGDVRGWRYFTTTPTLAGVFRLHRRRTWQFSTRLTDSGKVKTKSFSFIKSNREQVRRIYERKRDAIQVEFAPFGSSSSYFSPILWLALCYFRHISLANSTKLLFLCSGFSSAVVAFPVFHFVTSSIALWGSFMKFDKTTRVNQTKTGFELFFLLSF